MQVGSYNIQPVIDESFLVQVPLLDQGDFDHIIVTASASNHYTSGNYSSDTCCTCSTS